MLNLSLCNELLANEGMTLDEQCRVAASLGYFGLELAPGTLGGDPYLLDREQRQFIRSTHTRHGLVVTGLHCLLTPYPNLSITDTSVATRTTEVLLSMVDLCADIGGKVLVHGSPAQRIMPENMSVAENRDNVIAFFKLIAARAQERGVMYCLEPLSHHETDFVTSVAEGASIATAVGVDSFRTMIDTSAAGQSEKQTVANLIRQWVPTGIIGHIHLNDTNRGAPGTGNDPFYDIVKAIADVNWCAPIGVEPFETIINASVTAAIGYASIKAHFEGIQ